MTGVIRIGLVVAGCLVLGAAAVAQPHSDVVVIGSETWSAGNLEVTTFRNGDPIPEVKSDLDWKRAARNRQPAWCYYQNDPQNGSSYGKLYNWYAVNDERGLAPAGWHIPGKPELHELIEQLDKYFGSRQHADSLMMDDHPGTPQDSFFRLQGGYRLANGSFLSGGKYGFWWGTTCYLSTQSWLKHIHSGSPFRVHSFYHHGDGFSVRCVRDN